MGSECGHTLCRDCAEMMAPGTPRVECEDGNDPEIDTEMSATIDAIEAACAQASDAPTVVGVPTGGFFKGAAAESELAIIEDTGASNTTAAADSQDAELEALLQQTFDRFDVYGEGTITSGDDLIGMCLNVGSKSNLGILSSTIDEKAKIVTANNPNFTMTFKEFSTWFKTEILPEQHDESVSGGFFKGKSSEPKEKDASVGFFKGKTSSEKEEKSAPGGFFKGEAIAPQEESAVGGFFKGPATEDQTAAVPASNPLGSVASAFLDVGGFFSGPKSSTKKERRSGGGFFSGSEPQVPDVDEIMAAASRSGVDMSNAAELTQFTKDYAHSKSNQSTPRVTEAESGADADEKTVASNQSAIEAEAPTVADGFFKGKQTSPREASKLNKAKAAIRKKTAPSNEAAWF